MREIYEKKKKDWTETENMSGAGDKSSGNTIALVRSDRGPVHTTGYILTGKQMPGI